MKALIQRVQSGNVTVDGKIISEIDIGLVILLGIQCEDTTEDAKYLADKCVNLRIFSDAEGKFNLSAIDINADLLIVSQFTLYADCRKGRRPNFINAAPPEHSQPLYEQFVMMLNKYNLRVSTGVFGTHMIVNIVNDGPVTILVESKN